MRRIWCVWVFILCMVPAATAQQVPGYYRFPVGAAMVTALYDGYVRIGAKAYPGIAPDAVHRLFHDQFEADPPPVAINAYVVEIGKRRVMIDAGSATYFGPTAGRLPENLKAAGFSPESISAIFITHMHGDHVCGLSAGARRVFPNAEIWASETEIRWWLEDDKAMATAQGRSFAKTARKALAPYRRGHLHSFKDGQTFWDVITAVATPGHTPGHSAFRLTSQEQTLVFAGDILIGPAVQFPRPDISVRSDSNPELAILSRRKLLGAAADKRWAIAGAHIPFPGIVHIRRSGDGFAFVPVEYQPLP